MGARSGGEKRILDQKESKTSNIFKRKRRQTPINKGNKQSYEETETKKPKTRVKDRWREERLWLVLTICFGPKIFCRRGKSGRSLG